MQRQQNNNNNKKKKEEENKVRAPYVIAYAVQCSFTYCTWKRREEGETKLWNAIFFFFFFHGQHREGGKCWVAHGRRRRRRRRGDTCKRIELPFGGWPLVWRDFVFFFFFLPQTKRKEELIINAPPNDIQLRQRWKQQLRNNNEKI